MLDTLTVDTTQFASSYTFLKEKHHSAKYTLRQELAAANNCIAIGNSSCYADMVAVPRDYPDVVIKICSGEDMFIKYAHLCATGRLIGPSHLKIFSETEIAPGVWLYVMERLDRHPTPKEMEMTVDRVRKEWLMPKRGRYAGICKRLHADLNEMIVALEESGLDLGDFCTDLHRGNVMYRKDGTLVYVDPIC